MSLGPVHPHPNPPALLPRQAQSSIRCFTKPTESLERSLEMNKHKGKRRVQKRPNYKNVGEDEEEDKAPSEDTSEDAEKTKGPEGPKGSKASGESEGEHGWEGPFSVLEWGGGGCSISWEGHMMSGGPISAPAPCSVSVSQLPLLGGKSMSLSVRRPDVSHKPLKAMTIWLWPWG